MRYVFLFTIVFNLLSCTPSTYLNSEDTSIQINSATTDSKQAIELIEPYKIKLQAEMNEVLVISGEEFPKERGKAETKLGNLVADLCLETGNALYSKKINERIDFCLLNFGGLRTSLPKGEITRGKIFELMPFENELVIVTMREDKMMDILRYLKSNGGQPISGIKITFSQDDREENLKKRFSNNGGDQIKVLTSDYLANGGDKMNFFLDPIKKQPLGIKLRDAIIDYCIDQHKKGKQLTGKIEKRISFE